MISKDESELSEISLDELRYALMALAAGVPLESLKFKISAKLYELLQGNIDTLLANQSFATLGQSLDLTAEDFEFEFVEDHAVGESLVNFPRRFRHWPQQEKHRPISSLDVG
jgi:hypothetical protein